MKSGFTYNLEIWNVQPTTNSHRDITSMPCHKPPYLPTHLSSSINSITIHLFETVSCYGYFMITPACKLSDLQVVVVKNIITVSNMKVTKRNIISLQSRCHFFQINSFDSTSLQLPALYLA